LRRRAFVTRDARTRRRPTVHIGSIDDDPFPGVRFDRIVLNQVIEHIPEPQRLLPKLAAA
jgi:hypothetical protein